MNVIVVVCNSVHLGFLGAYGNAWIETPNLDRLAAEGVVFDHHFPENLTTLPTRRSWWTGRYTFPDEERGWTALGPDELILPDRLWDRGVRTALISDVPLLREVGLGYGRGFDDVVWVRGSGYDPLIPPGDRRAKGIRLEDEPGLRLPPDDDESRDRWKQRWEQFLRNRAALDTSKEENTGVARTVRAAIDWLERRGGEKDEFLLWLDLFSPHGPWDPPQPYRDQYATEEPDEFEAGEEGDLVEEAGDEEEIDIEEVPVLLDVPAGAVGEVLDEAELFRLRRTYAGTVTLVDRWLGELFDALRRMGRMEDTLVVFTSDQGEPLGEHGYVRRFRPWLYEELVHTPLIVRMPGGKHGGIRRQAIVQTVDLLPTIMAALGVPAGKDDDPPLHGHDILPLIRGEQTKVRDYACMGMDVEEFAIRTHHWHYILPLVSDPEEPRSSELYRKPEDRWDQNNVIEQFADSADQLELTLRRFVEALGRDAIEDVPGLRDAARLGGG
ncbi:Arylsulfatase [Aquisphaera giovannonii]|uniref:Arylsulfatase n=1 Tax=Aquisphaera giovannonii TaxID=406548 RepID=A0A5B9WCD6_9BACT|nr:sulfatase [Aquisphaera giovannonii]QEH37611.1 Arylsulfatase [Aquisphaera giovannonii]